MTAELQVIETPTAMMAPLAGRGGRYRVELRPRSLRIRCGHRSPHAVLWLIFLEAGREAGREITDTICSRCDPARFARVRAWAESLR